MGSSNEVLLPLLARKISVGTSRELESPNPPHCNREGLPSTSDVCGDWAGNFYPMWHLIRQYSPFPLLEWYHSKPTKNRLSKQDPVSHNIIPQIPRFQSKIVHQITNQKALQTKAKDNH